METTYEQHHTASQELTLEERKKLLTQIDANFFNLCLNCTYSLDFYNKFLENKVAFLTTGYTDDDIVWMGCGLKIPEYTYVNLNARIAWPILYLKDKKDHKNIAVIRENPREVYEEIKKKDYTLRLRRETVKYADLEIRIQEKLKDDNIEAYLDFPFFLVANDMLMNVEIEDQSEIILTCC